MVGITPIDFGFGSFITTRVYVLYYSFYLGSIEIRSQCRIYLRSQYMVASLVSTTSLYYIETTLSLQSDIPWHPTTIGYNNMAEGIIYRYRYVLIDHSTWRRR